MSTEGARLARQMMSQESTYVLAIITCLQIPCAARSLSKASREHGELGSRSQPWDDVSDQFGFDPSADACIEISDMEYCRNPGIANTAIYIQDISHAPSAAYWIRHNDGHSFLDIQKNRIWIW